MKKEIIVFDTNIWIKLFNTNNTPPKYNYQFLNKLKENSLIGILNISLIEYLMRFKRKNNISKIKEIIKYIRDNNIYIGQISCSNFDSYPENYNYLLNLNDEEIIDEINKLQNIRLCFKCSVITLWVECLIELFFIAIIDKNEDFNKVFTTTTSKTKVIYDELFDYFLQNELYDKKIKNNICEIVNKIYLNIIFNIDNLNFRYDSKIYKDLCSQLNNLKKDQSISYIYKGIYNTEIMQLYNNIINSSLEELFNNNIFTEIFHERLYSFTQGEPLQRNDVEDMLMIATLELDKYNQMTIVTNDKKMNEKLQKLNSKNANDIYNKLFNLSEI